MVPDAHALTGAYVLNALPDEERRTLETHCAVCLPCAQELRELQATAARLGLAMTAAAPKSLKDKVLHGTRTLPQDALWPRPFHEGSQSLRCWAARWFSRLSLR